MQDIIDVEMPGWVIVGKPREGFMTIRPKGVTDNSQDKKVLVRKGKIVAMQG